MTLDASCLPFVSDIKNVLPKVAYPPCDVIGADLRRDQQNRTSRDHRWVLQVAWAISLGQILLYSSAVAANKPVAGAGPSADGAGISFGVVFAELRIASKDLGLPLLVHDQCATAIHGHPYLIAGLGIAVDLDHP